MSSVTTPSQSFAHGTPPSWGTLGGRRGLSLLDPNLIIAFICSESNAGKSFLLHSNPDAFVFNLDFSSVANPHAQALVWPEIDRSTGRPINSEGKPGNIRFEDVLMQCAILLDLANRNMPRPRIVGIDTLTTLMPLAVDYVTRNAKRLCIVKDSDPDPEHFRQLNGMSAYAAVYDIIVDLIVKLHNAGYGVYIFGHITQTKVPTGADLMTWKWDLNLGNGLWNRLFPLLELSLSLSKRNHTEFIKVPQPDIITPQGPRKVPDKVTPVTTVKRYLTTKVPADYLGGLVKCRIPDFEIELTAKDTWKNFVTQYNDLQTQVK